MKFESFFLQPEILGADHRKTPKGMMFEACSSDVLIAGMGPLDSLMKNTSRVFLGP